MKDSIKSDLHRLGRGVGVKCLINTLITNHGFRHMYYWRNIVEGRNIFNLYYRYKLRNLRLKTGVEIPYSVKIGKGLYLCHPYCITVNSKAVIGDNVTLYKGCTIGNQKRGKKSGAPVIGNNVYIGLNSTIVGNVKIGDNVLIAPNTYINIDIPSNSIVIGNPCVVHYCKDATKDYIINTI